MSENVCEALNGLNEIIAKLTGPDGCPWDREQTPESLADYVIEESHELVAAIRNKDAAAIRDEMGDVFFLLLFIAHLCRDRFSLAEVLQNASAKMIRRHPHVFAGAAFDTRDEQLKAWENIKKQEHDQKGLFASLPATLPPLLKAYRIHSKAARAGFTWPSNEEAERQVESEWLEWLDVAGQDDENAKKHELGDMIFTLVELGRRHGIKASEAVDLACRRFLARFESMERLAAVKGRDITQMSLDEQDELWLAAKESEA